MPVWFQKTEEGGRLMHRRTFLLSAAAGALAAGVGALPRLGYAQSRPFTFTSWGGALSDAEKSAFTDPFAEEKGIQIVNTSPTETAKIKAMVEAGARSEERRVGKEGRARGGPERDEAS